MGGLALVDTQRLFRKEALDRLSSPEQLDRTLSVTSARGWIALAAILVVVTAVAVWSFLGRISNYVRADGLLLSRGGTVVDAVATGQGRLASIAVSLGERIEEGAVVATVEDDALRQRHSSARALAEELAETLETLRDSVAKEDALARANSLRRRRHLDELIAAAGEILETAETRFENNRALFEEGVIASGDLAQMRQEVNGANRALLDLQRDRDLLEVEEIRREHANAVRIRETEGRHRAAMRAVQELETQMVAGRVLSPVAGHVTEIKAVVGAVVNPGEAVLSLHSGLQELEMLVYVPPGAGKRVEPGMDALVSPVTVRREEFGAIRGTVASLSSFPISLDGMLATLPNRSLAETFSRAGPPYAGRIALSTDATTASGFAWTSPKAASQTLTSGTLATVEIRTGSQPPIELVIPLLRELTGL